MYSENVKISGIQGLEELQVKRSNASHINLDIYNRTFINLRCIDYCPVGPMLSRSICVLTFTLTQKSCVIRINLHKTNEQFCVKIFSC